LISGTIPTKGVGDRVGAFDFRALLGDHSGGVFKRRPNNNSRKSKKDKKPHKKFKLGS